jgi:hypothetical protein
MVTVHPYRTVPCRAPTIPHRATSEYSNTTLQIKILQKSSTDMHIMVIKIYVISLHIITTHDVEQENYQGIVIDAPHLIVTSLVH